MERILEYFYRRLDQYYAEGDLEAVERFLLDYKQETKQRGGDVLIAVCDELGSFYRGTSRYEESVSAFQEAGDAIAAQLGTDCVEYATLLNNMAGTFRLAGQQERAVNYFSKAVDIYHRQGAEDGSHHAADGRWCHPEREGVRRNHRGSDQKRRSQPADHGRYR